MFLIKASKASSLTELSFALSNNTNPLEPLSLSFVSRALSSYKYSDCLPCQKPFANDIPARRVSHSAL